MHPVLLSDDDLLAECDVTRLRRGGPGGQHRNKVETAVRIEHRPTGLISEANETRSQERNRREAISRLRLALAIQVREDVERDSNLQQTWDTHRRGTKMVSSATARSGPALVAFAFDVLDTNEYDLGPAANRLGVTSSQLRKFLLSDRSVWTAFNKNRVSAGRQPLHS